MDNRQWLEQQREQSGYSSVDPAPPAPVADLDPDVDALAKQLMDTTLPMFQRMRAVFSLRNIGGDAAVDALAQAFEDPSALLRHEIAYVMGQMADAHALPVLTRVLADEHEHVMVRHEAAEAMGAIGDESARPTLQKFSTDPHPEVAESCVVALDLLDWVNSDQLEYTEW
ncbi:MAG: HEAT repeat domain-containing protein [Thermoplasmatota archaeon]